MVAAIKAAAKDGDSLGGVVEVLAYGVPVGLGQPRALGPRARRPAGPGPHEHPGRQGASRSARAGTSPAGGGRRPTTPSAGTSRSGRRLPARDRPGRRHRGRDVDRRADRGPGGHEAAGHAQPPRARDGRRGHQGVDGSLQGAHRRHRRAGHGRGGRDDDRARAGRPRRCASSAATRWPRCVRNRDGFVASLGETPSAAPDLVRTTAAAVTAGLEGSTRGPAGRDDGRGQVDGRPAAGRPARAGPTSTPTRRWRRPPARRCPRSSRPRGEAAFRAAEAARARPSPRRPTPRWSCRWPAARSSTRPTGTLLRRLGHGGLAAGPARDPGRAGWATAADRPLLGGRPGAPRLDRLDAERRPLYAEVADVVVDVDGRDPLDVADRGRRPSRALVAAERPRDAGGGRRDHRARRARRAVLRRRGRRGRPPRAGPVGGRSGRRRRSGSPSSPRRAASRPTGSPTSTPACPSSVHDRARRRGGQVAGHRRGAVPGLRPARPGPQRRRGGRRRWRGDRRGRLRRRRLPPRDART